MTDTSFYYSALGRAYARAYAVFGFVVCISLIAANIAVGFKVLAGVAAFSYGYVVWHYGGGQGVAVRSDGIYVRRWFRFDFIPWQDVNVFRIKHASLSPPVYVELVSGQMRMLPLTQGRQMAWPGGKSKDIVAVLNDELRRARDGP
jgi:hypothetical protein